jgi:hypothetical protein
MMCDIAIPDQNGLYMMRKEREYLPYCFLHPRRRAIDGGVGEGG